MTQRQKFAAAYAPTALGVVCLLAVSVVPPGATRVFAWPWSLLYAAALLGPACTVIARAFDRDCPLAPPVRGWQWIAIGTAVAITLAALVSPYRGVSLRWSAPLLANVAVFCIAVDFVATAPVLRPAIFLWRALTAFVGVLGVVSFVEWLCDLRVAPLRTLIASRNSYPLGHSNYTAGLAILLFTLAAGLIASRRESAPHPTPGQPSRARRSAPNPGANPGMAPQNEAAPSSRRLSPWPVLGWLGVAFSVALLFSSGSRGGLIALAVILALLFWSATVARRVKVWAAVAALVIGGVVVGANPRLRAMLLPADPNAPPNISNVQRHAMLQAGLVMGRDRFWTGWGSGTTPLVFPRYRAQLTGGAEDVLQLHSLPVQLWADLGLLGIVAGVAIVMFVLRDARHEPRAALALAGYGVFSLFDAQLDLPVFGFVLAVLLGLVASAPARQRESPPPQPGAKPPRSRALALGFGVLTLCILAVVSLVGRDSSAALLNVAALSPDVGRKQPDRAIRLLQESLAKNPDQEIAHFNLGWLLLTRAPAAAELHFRRAAHLVPDKGGVYFGLGLTFVNRGDGAAASRAFALETLNDPLFAVSPWWKNPALAPLRAATAQRVADLLAKAAWRLPGGSWPQREANYLAAFLPWLDGQVSAAAVARVADTKSRQEYFRGQPQREDVLRLPAETLVHERVGYPVLMRNLDFAPPVDLWTIQQSSARTSALAFLWPDKGWLPSPLLIALLDDAPSTKK